jgi:hypothetical protein
MFRTPETGASWVSRAFKPCVRIGSFSHNRLPLMARGSRKDKAAARIETLALLEIYRATG